MKERYDLWKVTLDEITSITKKEYCMMITICLLLGILLGILFSPKKCVTLGSFNGSNNNTKDEEDYEEEIKSCDWN